MLYETRKRFRIANRRRHFPASLPRGARGRQVSGSCRSCRSRARLNECRYLVNVFFANEVCRGVVGDKKFVRRNQSAGNSRYETLGENAGQGRSKLNSDLVRWFAGKESMMRLIDWAASFVCSVESTRCPVSAAETAVAIVSISSISPIKMTLTSSLENRAERRTKTRVSIRTSRWSIMDFLASYMYSIGSSMVTMCSARGALMCSTIAARVVVLPRPTDRRQGRILGACRKTSPKSAAD